MIKLIVGVLALSLVLAGCGDDDETTTEAEMTTTTSEVEETTTTTTEATDQIRPETEDALRACGTGQADVAMNLHLGDLDFDAYEEANDACDTALGMLETDIGGGSALTGMSISLRNTLLAKWQQDVAEFGEARPAETGLTALDAATNWERQFDEEIDELTE